MDARRAMFFALTYKQQPSDPNKAFEDSNVRMALWAATLKALGHVVHLLQDQASPQHARGERHNHTCEGPTSVANEDFATRTYENYTNYLLVSVFNQSISAENQRYIASNDCEEDEFLPLFQRIAPVTSPASIPWISTIYPTPQFSVQRKFFTTRAAGDSTNPSNLSLALVNQRRGLGDYSNRGFYTQGNQAGEYQSPPAGSSPQFVRGTGQEDIFIPGLGPMRIAQLFWQVPDPVQPGFADTGLVNGRAPIISRTVWWHSGRHSGCAGTYHYRRMEQYRLFL